MNISITFDTQYNLHGLLNHACIMNISITFDTQYNLPGLFFDVSLLQLPYLVKNLVAGFEVEMQVTCDIPCNQCNLVNEQNHLQDLQLL